MPRFFFYVYDDVVAIDDDGVELPDLEAARREAVRGARSLAAEQVTEGRLILHHRVEAVDEGGNVVASVTFGDVVTVEP